jgi:hypothetical protein
MLETAKRVNRELKRLAEARAAAIELAQLGKPGGSMGQVR